MIKMSVCVHMLVCNQRFKYFHIGAEHVTCATEVNVSAFVTAYISACKYPKHSKTPLVSYKLKLEFSFFF